MIKSELIARMASKMMHLPEHKIAQAVNHILDVVTQSLIEGKRIEVRGFGSFSIHLRNPRNAHNPKTGEKVVTLPKSTPHFKPGKELRERVNASREENPIRE